MSLTHASHLQSATIDQPEPAAAPAAPSRVAPVTGLMVGSADDRAEHDADSLADAALRRLHAGAAGAASGTSSGTPSDDVHAHGPSCGHLRRSAAPTSGAVVGAAGGALDAGTSAQIAARTGGGRGLPDGLRRSMEGAFGTGLGHVRIHDDSTSASLNKAVSARAFTTGSDIFFGAGQYAPHDAVGQRVLAHELAHVVTEGGAAPLRRWSISSLFKTPEEKAEQKLKDEAESRAKTLEKDEAARLKQSRKDGEAGRQGHRDRIYGADGTASMADSGAAITALTGDFEKALASEKAAARDLATAHAGDPDWTPERIADVAYRATWLTGPYAQSLSSVRPPRETAAERLVSEIRVARTAANVRAPLNAELAGASRLGTMLPKDVERTYEKYIATVQHRMSRDSKLTADAAHASAEADVWGLAPDSIKKKRPPKGSALDTRAQLDARARLAAAPRPELSTMEKVDGASDTALGHVGTGESVIGKLQSQIASRGQEKDTALNPNNTAAPSYTSEPLGVGETVHAAREAAANYKAGNVSGEGPDYPKSVETKVAEGMGTVTSVFTSLASSVDGVIKFVKALKASQGSKDPRKDLAAAKAGFDGLSKLTDSAKATANFAVLIDSAIEDNVKKVIPGLNIVTAVLSVASNAMTLVDKSMRMNETNTALLEARIADPTAQNVNVLVYPLIRVAQKFSKNLEQASWSTAIAISEVVTSITTVATGGGFGIPTAVQTGVGVLDKLHSLGHFIADEYFTFLSKQATEASIGALEGSAEQVLLRTPGMAVDGIILRAAGGDAQALAFLANYEVDGRTVDAALLAKVYRQPGGAPQPAAGATPPPLPPRPGAQKPPPVPARPGSSAPPPVPARPGAKTPPPVPARPGSSATPPPIPARPGAKTPPSLPPRPGAAAAVPSFDEDVLFKIRSAVLVEMGEDADPEYAYTALKSTVGDFFTGVSEKWASTGDLADKRNRMDGAGIGKTPEAKEASRGFGWRLKMMLKGEGKFERSLKKTDVNWEDAASRNVVRSADVAIVCGSLRLDVGYTPADLEAFLTTLGTLSDAAIMAGAKSTENSVEGQDILMKYLTERKAAATSAATPAAAGVAQVTP